MKCIVFVTLFQALALCSIQAVISKEFIKLAERKAMAIASLLDTVAPTVTLSGAATIRLEINSSFTDPGASATDAHDGSLQVRIDTGNLDVNKEGIYIVTYTATDAAGNSSSVERTVTVVGTSGKIYMLGGELYSSDFNGNNAINLSQELSMPGSGISETFYSPEENQLVIVQTTVAGAASVTLTNVRGENRSVLPVVPSTMKSPQVDFNAGKLYYVDGSIYSVDLETNTTMMELNVQPVSPPSGWTWNTGEGWYYDDNQKKWFYLQGSSFSLDATTGNWTPATTSDDNWLFFDDQRPWVFSLDKQQTNAGGNWTYSAQTAWFFDSAKLTWEKVDLQGPQPSGTTPGEKIGDYALDPDTGKIIVEWEDSSGNTTRVTSSSPGGSQSLTVLKSGAALPYNITSLSLDTASDTLFWTEEKPSWELYKPDDTIIYSGDLNMDGKKRLHTLSQNTDVQIRYDTGRQKLFIHDGSNWMKMDPGPGNSPQPISGEPWQEDLKWNDAPANLTAPEGEVNNGQAYNNEE